MVLITTIYHKLPPAWSPSGRRQKLLGDNTNSNSNSNKEPTHIPNAVQVLDGMRESQINYSLSS